MFFHRQELQHKAAHPVSRLYGTTEIPNIVEKAAGKIQDVLHRE